MILYILGGLWLLLCIANHHWAVFTALYPSVLTLILYLVVPEQFASLHDYGTAIGLLFVGDMIFGRIIFILCLAILSDMEGTPTTGHQ